jgi:uncharacterized membrane protein (DUF485 family)
MPTSDSQPPAVGNARLGVIMFLIYLAFYAGFVLLAAFAPTTMQRTPFAGENLAIWYGFALIIAAILLALLYGLLCRSSPSLEGRGQGRD